MRLLLTGRELLSVESKGLLQPPLGVLASVDKVGVVEGQLNSALGDGIDGLNTEHEGVVLVANLVPPAAESATGVDAQVLELGEELLEDTLALKGRGGVTVVKGTVVGGDDLILGLEEVGVDKSLNAVLQDVLDINGLQLRLGNLQHDGPVGTLLGLGRVRSTAVSLVQSRELDVLLRLVVRGVVGKDGGTVEVAVVLGEVQPALVTNALRALTTNTNTDNVSSRVEETLGEADELLVANLLGEVVNSHGADELAVSDCGTVSKVDDLLLGVNLGDLTSLAEALLLLGDGVGNSSPDTTSTVTGRESKGGVGAPVTSNLV